MVLYFRDISLEHQQYVFYFKKREDGFLRWETRHYFYLWFSIELMIWLEFTDICPGPWKTDVCFLFTWLIKFYTNRIYHGIHHLEEFGTEKFENKAFTENKSFIFKQRFVLESCAITPCLLFKTYHTNI